MKFKSKLIKGKFQKRYKRFFADVLVDDQVVVAHLANTGSMNSCLIDNGDTLLSFHDSPTRKLKYSLEMIHNGRTWIGVNTSLTNALAIEGIKNGVISELQNYNELKPEVKVGESRIDILLSNGEFDQCYVEVKNVTLVPDHQDYCLFPDAKTERGQKHLRELMELKSRGIRTAMLFIVQREDCQSFQIRNDIDPVYSKLLSEAIKFGVEVLVYQCHLSESEIKVEKKLPLI